jgi:hypothetical protein
VQQILAAELRTHLRALDTLITSDLARLNEQLRAKDLPIIADRAAPRRLTP